MIISRNIRVQLTAEERQALRAAAKICDELMDIKEIVDNYDIDFGETYANLLSIINEDRFEYADKEEE